MGKRPSYDDEFRANAVLMLEAAGYPHTIGALAKVSARLKVPGRTISRWFNKEQNPPPDHVVSIKKGELVEKIDHAAHMIADAIPDRIEGAELRELATALGILVDKKQLLTGGATERHEHNINDARDVIDRRIAGLVAQYRPDSDTGQPDTPTA